MKVLLLLDKLNSPDTQRDLELLTTRLDPSHVQIEVCSLRDGVSATAHHLPDLPGLNQHRLNAHFSIDPLACQRLIRLLRQRGIELVHALEPSMAYYAAIAGRLVGIPTLVSCYYIAPLRNINWLQWRRQQLRWQLLRLGIDRVIVPSEIMRRQLWYAVNYPRQRVEIVYSGVDFTEPIAPLDRAALGLPDGPLVTMVLPDDEDSGYETILDALPRLKQRVPDVHLVIIGTGAFVTTLQRKASQIRPALPIRWLGKANVRDVMAVSDVIVAHPSRDGVPRALMQAAAAGKPAVAVRIGGVTEIIEPLETGLLVTPGDISDFIIQVSRLLTQPTFAARIGQAALRRAQERFSLEAQRDAMTILYEETIYASR